MAGNLSLIYLASGPPAGPYLVHRFAASFMAIGRSPHASFQKRIVALFVANCGRVAVTGNDERVVVEGHELLLNGAEYLLIGAAPEIGATDALHEERIARKQDIAIAREMKRRTAGRMAGRVDHTHLDTLACDCIAIAHETVDNTALRRGHTDPLRLHVQLFEK